MKHYGKNDKKEIRLNEVKSELLKKVSITDFGQYNGEKCRFYVSITKVSSSGMSRCMKIYILKNDRLENITQDIAELTGNTYTKNYELRISGCGMDMIFEVLYQTFQKLFNETYNTPNRYQDYTFSYNRI